MNVEIIRFSSGETDEFAAEVWIDGVQWADVFENESAKLLVRFYPHPEAGVWEFDYQQSLDLLSAARTKLHSPSPFTN